jgi:hypothetical protein
LKEKNLYKTALQDSISRVKAKDTSFFVKTVSRDAFITSAETVVQNFEKDIQKIAGADAILFPSLKDGPLPKSAGKNLADVFLDWRDDPPSIAAIIAYGAEKFGIDQKSPFLRAALLTAVAADVPNANPYHSIHHYREVTCAMIRLLHAHAQIAGEVPLDTNDMAKCLLAAAGHDLLHDGNSNGLTQYRLEDQSFFAMAPFMTLSGVGEKSQQDIHTMIRATDISAHNGHPSPQRLLRHFYAGDNIALCEGISAAASDKKLLTMAALLGDADLTPSGATDLAFIRTMSTYVHRETPSVQDTPQSTLGFIRFVIGEKHATAAGQAVGQAALVDMITQLQNISAPLKPPRPLNCNTDIAA